jgi:OTT_1508-like deaminase
MVERDERGLFTLPMAMKKYSRMRLRSQNCQQRPNKLGRSKLLATRQTNDVLAPKGLDGKHQDDGDALIGVSKNCCKWCSEYRRAMNKHLHNLDISVLALKSHNKQVAGWMLPPMGPAEANKDLEYYESMIEQRHQHGIQVVAGLAMRDDLGILETRMLCGSLLHADRPG